MSFTATHTHLAGRRRFTSASRAAVPCAPLFAAGLVTVPLVAGRFALLGMLLITGALLTAGAVSSSKPRNRSCPPNGFAHAATARTRSEMRMLHAGEVMFIASLYLALGGTHTSAPM